MKDVFHTVVWIFGVASVAQASWRYLALFQLEAAGVATGSWWFNGFFGTLKLVRSNQERLRRGGLLYLVGAIVTGASFLASVLVAGYLGFSWFFGPLRR